MDLLGYALLTLLLAVFTVFLAAGLFYFFLRPRYWLHIWGFYVREKFRLLFVKLSQCQISDQNKTPRRWGLPEADVLDRLTVLHGWDVNRWSLEEANILNELGVLRGSADESARHVRGLYVTFLLFSFYIAVIVFSTTDQQLLKETGARLPLLNVELPLLGFYIFIPWLVFIFHVHLVIQFFLLSRKLHNLNQAIELLPGNIQHNYRELPFPLVFSHTIVGRHHPDPLRWAFSAAVVVTVVIIPITLLLAIQWKFLSYHNSWITLNHQIVFVFDLLLLWTFWPRMPARSGQWWEGECTWTGWLQTKRQRSQILRMFAAGVSTMVVLVISTLLLVPPGDGIEHFLGKQTWLNILHRNLDLQEKTLMRTEPPPELIAAYKAAGDPKEKVWLDHGKPLDLQRRDLRNANFEQVTLWDVDLREAQLQGAVFVGAKLQDADLGWAQLQGANLGEAQLQGAELGWAQLQGAVLEWAQLQGADLREAQLQGADLGWAQLQGADLGEAQLQGADLGWAQLQGADLGGAQLQGADLRGAQLQGADLAGTQLQGAVLRGARFYATEFAEADLSIADIRELVSAPVRWDGDLFKTMEHLESTLTISAKGWSDGAQRRVQRALSRFWNIAFDTSLNKTLPLPSQVTGALYDRCGLFADWPSPPDINTFEADHAAFLADLSCSGNEYVVKAIVRRARIDQSFTLAQTLLNKTASKACSELAKVVEINREELEDITQKAKEAPP